MDLPALKQAILGLGDKPHSERIKIFGWWLHVHKAKPAFNGADITRCYTDLHYSPPSSFGGYIQQLLKKKELIKVGGGYKLENKVRGKFEAAYGTPEVTIKVNDLLDGLGAKIPDMAERAYYQEALICYRHGSMRGAVVMTWNITYSHLCDHVLAKRLADFNARWLVAMPGKHKNGQKTIKVFDDFNDELKESEVLTLCRDAGIVTKNIYNIMHAALGRRNAAAHPNAVVIDKIQTDAYIVDLVTNVIQQIV
jgi:hypothetical protein